mmetsp:Transcript_94508/g.266847  ORF Transcript_94508/g.266847 Transcript_94508/m.266847 type:complete len:229 (-) Transcript_94508:645-1331(-)
MWIPRSHSRRLVKHRRAYVDSSLKDSRELVKFRRALRRRGLRADFCSRKRLWESPSPRRSQCRTPTSGLLRKRRSRKGTKRFQQRHRRSLKYLRSRQRRATRRLVGGPCASYPLRGWLRLQPRPRMALMCTRIATWRSCKGSTARVRTFSWLWATPSARASAVDQEAFRRASRLPGSILLAKASASVPARRAATCPGALLTRPCAPVARSVSGRPSNPGRANGIAVSA